MTTEYYLPPLPAHWEHGLIDFVRYWGRAAIKADRQTNKTLMHYMPETIAALKATGCNKSLVTDIEKATRGEADRQARGEPVAQVTVNDDGTQTWVALKTQWLPKGVYMLYTAPQPQQIPEGYKMVHSLAEVWEINAAAFKEYGYDSRAEVYNECAKELRAMLEAAPEPKGQ